MAAFGVHWGVLAALPLEPLACADESGAGIVWLEAGVGAEGATSAASEAPASHDQIVATPPEKRPREAASRSVAEAALPQPRSTDSAETGGADSSPSEGEAAQQQAESTTGEGKASAENSGAKGKGVAGGFARGPVLLGATARCASYFPANTRVEHGEVDVDVHVDATGYAGASTVLIESPAGQGFGFAARGCVRVLRFMPAVDGTGSAVRGRAKLRLRFDRPTTT